jgi:hypothetical protein
MTTVARPDSPEEPYADAPSVSALSLWPFTEQEARRARGSRPEASVEPPPESSAHRPDLHAPEGADGTAAMTANDDAVHSEFASAFEAQPAAPAPPPAPDAEEPSTEVGRRIDRAVSDLLGSLGTAGSRTGR